MHITMVPALAVLGDAETVVDRAVAAGGVQPRSSGAPWRAGTPVTASIVSGEFFAQRDEIAPLLECRRLAALGRRLFVNPDPR